MKYFYDTEFVENGRTINLLSIGIVAEDGREFYAQTLYGQGYKKTPNLCPNTWVRENVIPHLDESGLYTGELQKLLLDFCAPEKYGKPQFWGYYADYDHVALCQLFGTMMDLPKGWPMYTMDIKQLCVSLGDPGLPEQKSTEHHALADARWNKQAYEFLMQVTLDQSKG
jgi:hypothetical protein